MTRKRALSEGGGVRSVVYDVEQVACLLQISVRQVWRLSADGTMPPPMTFGRLKRWSREQLEAWIRAGAPPWAEWGKDRQ